MSKSIYDEALDVIENIDRNLHYTWVVGRDNLIKTKQALEKAKKLEKMLELYRCLNENANDYDLHPDTVDEIHNKIEELENEK